MPCVVELWSYTLHRTKCQIALDALLPTPPNMITMIFTKLHKNALMRVGTPTSLHSPVVHLRLRRGMVLEGVVEVDQTFVDRQALPRLFVLAPEVHGHEAAADDGANVETDGRPESEPVS